MGEAHPQGDQCGDVDQQIGIAPAEDHLQQVVGFPTRTTALAQTADQQPQGEEGQGAIGDAAHQQAGADHQALGLAAMVIDIADGLENTPGREGDQTDHHQADQKVSEGLGEQGFQAVVAVRRLAGAACGEQRQDADDEIDEATSGVAAASQQGKSGTSVHLLCPVTFCLVLTGGPRAGSNGRTDVLRGLAASGFWP